MTLHLRTLLIIAAVLLTMIGAQYLLSQLILAEGFVQLEERDTNRNLARAVNALHEDISGLHAVTRDWAHWDDSYAFVQNHNSDFIDSNLATETFIANSFSVMLFMDSSQQIVYAEGVDLNTGEPTTVSPDLLTNVSSRMFPLNAREISEDMTLNGLSGIIALPEGTLLLAAAPILHSDLSGPRNGVILFGRYLDDTHIGHLATNSQLSINIYPLNAPQLPADVRQARTTLLRQESRVIESLDDDTIAGYALIDDIYGQPSLILRIDIPRDILSQGRSSLTYFLASLLVTGVIFISATLLILERTVLSRLASLSETVTRIHSTNDLTLPIQVKGNDELANLATGLKQMLDALAQSQMHLKEANEGLEKRVTDRTAELDRARERVETILNSSSDAILLLSAEGNIHQVNPTFDQMLLCRDDEYLYAPLTQLVHPDQGDAVKQAIQRAAQGHSASLEVTILRKNNTTFEGELNFTPVLDHAGVATNLVCNLHDLTRHKQAEQVLQRALTNEQELNALKTRFVSMVSHEFRNPLVAIQMMIETIRVHQARMTETQLTTQFDKIGGQITHMTRLLDDVLTIGRIQSGKLELKPVMLNLHQFCESIVTEVEIAYNAPSRIQYNCNDKTAQVLFDTSLMHLAINNLLTNAVKYSPNGHPIEFTVTLNNHHATLQITDHGIGIPAHKLKRLFEPFLRADNVGSIPGTGLGLSITQQAIELHGGTITCTSEVGQGTVFTVEIPVQHP